MSIDALRIGPGFRINAGVHMKGFTTGGISIPQYGPLPPFYAIGGANDTSTTASVNFYTAPANSTTFVFTSSDADASDGGYATGFTQLDTVENGAAVYYEYLWVSYLQNSTAVTNGTAVGGTGAMNGSWISIVDSLVGLPLSGYTSGPSVSGHQTMENDNGAPLHDTTNTVVTFTSYTLPTKQIAVLFSGVEVAGAQITSIVSDGLTWRRKSSKTNYSSYNQGEYQTAEMWYAVNDTGIDVTTDVTITYASPYDDQAAIISSWADANLLLPWTNSARAVPNPATNVGGINLKGISTPPLAPWYPMVTTEPAGLHNGKFTINSTATYGVPAGFTFANEMAWNFRDVDHTTVTNGNQTVEANGSETATYADWAIGPTDKVMFSVTMDVWNGNNYADAVGVGDGSMTTSYGGSDPSCYAVYDNGGPYTSDGEVLNGMYPYPVFQHDGAVIDVAVDRVNNSMWIRVDGGPWNTKGFTINSTDNFNNHYAYGNYGGIGSVTVDVADSYLSSWRLFILDSVYPDLGNQVIVGTIVNVAWSGVTATVTDIIHDTGYGRWVFIVDQNLQSGFSSGPKIASFAIDGGANWLSTTQLKVTPSAGGGSPTPENTTYSIYAQLENPIDTSLTGQIDQAFATVGMKSDTDGLSGAYLWNVTWADNSTDVVRLQWNNQANNVGRLQLSVVDTTAPGWNTPNSTTNYPVYPNKAAKMGTFTFPATFTPRLPIIVDGTNLWC